MITPTPRRFARLLLCGLWLSGVAGISFAATAPQFRRDIAPEKLVANPAEIAKMDALLKSMVDEQKLNAVVGFIAKGGNVVYHRAFGWKDIENQIPAKIDDYYVIMSQTKAIVTVAFMTLVEQGKVAIDDPVSKYFPEIPDRVVTKVNPDGTYETRPVKSPMTFVHLMSHTSGLGAGLVSELRGGRGGPPPAAGAAAAPAGGPGRSGRTLKDAMHETVKLPLGFDPGSDYHYHPSSSMLAYMIERISGKSLRDYVREKVLLPLGMNDTDWAYPAEAQSRFVKTYRVANGKLEPSPGRGPRVTIENATYFDGAAGMNGTIEDYAKFCQMMLNKGELNGRRILKPETVAQMTTINRLLPETSAKQRGMQFGLGFEIHKTKKPVPAVSDSAFAWGGALGTQYMIDPERDLVLLFYQNMSGSTGLSRVFYQQAYKMFDPPAAAASATK
ncbi:MAG: serine hydrolase domain-containing protein [Opitutaceae bacterium]